MPNPSTPCGWATPEKALRLFQGWPANRASCQQLSFTPLDTAVFSSVFLVFLSFFFRLSFEYDSILGGFILIFSWFVFGHWSRRGRSPLISSHMDVHSVCPSICPSVRLYVCTSVHPYPPPPRFCPTNGRAGGMNVHM
jgi:hypothetical protein